MQTNDENIEQQIRFYKRPLRDSIPKNVFKAPCACYKNNVLKSGLWNLICPAFPLFSATNPVSSLQ